MKCPIRNSFLIHSALDVVASQIDGGLSFMKVVMITVRASSGTGASLAMLPSTLGPSVIVQAKRLITKSFPVLYRVWILYHDDVSASNHL